MTSKFDHPYGYCPGCKSHPAAHLHVERTDDLDELRAEVERLRYEADSLRSDRLDMQDEIERLRAEVERLRQSTESVNLNNQQVRYREWRAAGMPDEL